MVNNVERYKVLSTLDLKSAYYQEPIREEKLYTVFETDSKLYEFNCIPFGVKNGVAVFHQMIDEILKKEVKDTFVYADNVTLWRD